MLPQDIQIEPDELVKMDFDIAHLGEALLDTPLQDVNYVQDTERINLFADESVNAWLRKRYNRSFSFLAACSSRLMNTSESPDFV